MTAYDVDAKVRELLRGPNVGVGDGDTYIPRSPTHADLAAALREARETAIDQVVSKILEVETVAVRDGASAEARQWLYGARSAALYVKSLLTPSEKEMPDAS